MLVMGGRVRTALRKIKHSKAVRWHREFNEYAEDTSNGEIFTGIVGGAFAMDAAGPVAFIFMFVVTYILNIYYFTIVGESDVIDLQEATL